jgi:hypothetical protein
VLLLGVLLHNFLANLTLGGVPVALDGVLHGLSTRDRLFTVRALHVFIHLVRIPVFDIPLYLADPSPFLLSIYTNRIS